MAIYDLNDPRQYLKMVKDIERYKDNKQLIEIIKFHPVQTEKQANYIHFMISYLSWKMGDTFYTTLRDIQRHVCPHIFYTNEVDKGENRKYKPLSALNTADASSVIRNVIDYAAVRGISIPEPDDKVGLAYCKKELESADGWV